MVLAYHRTPLSSHAGLGRAIDERAHRAAIRCARSKERPGIYTPRVPRPLAAPPATRVRYTIFIRSHYSVWS